MNPIETESVLFGEKFRNLEEADFESGPLYRFIKKKLAEKGMLPKKDEIDIEKNKQQ